jgi:hypothetical protein
MSDRTDRRRVILRAAGPKARLVSPLPLRRVLGGGGACGAGWVNAFTSSRNCFLSVSAKRGAFRSMAGWWLSPRGSQVSRLSSFAPASLSLSLSRGLAFLLLPLAPLRHLGGVARKVDGVFRLGVAPVHSLLTFAFLLRR